MNSGNGNIIIEISVSARLAEDEYKWARIGEHKATLGVPIACPLADIATRITPFAVQKALENRVKKCQEDDLKQERMYNEAVQKMPVLIVTDDEIEGVTLPPGTPIRKYEQWEVLEEEMVVRVASNEKERAGLRSCSVKQAGLRSCSVKQAGDKYYGYVFHIRTVNGKGEGEYIMPIILPKSDKE